MLHPESGFLIVKAISRAAKSKREGKAERDKDTKVGASGMIPPPPFHHAQPLHYVECNRIVHKKTWIDPCQPLTTQTCSRDTHK